MDVNATYVKELEQPQHPNPEPQFFGFDESLGPTHDTMAKNVGESRIPVPRAARPSFFPKSRVLGTSTLLPGHRRSLVLSGCLQFVDAEDESTTPKTKCLARATSTPSIEDSGHKTFTISPVWDKDDVQQLVHFAEEKSSFFSLLENSQLNMIEDTGESCLLEASLGNYNENSVSATPHYLMLNKQNSFEHDESLGILTPDQMTDFTVALECSRTPSCENLTGSAGSRLALTRASASRPSVDVEPTEEASSERTPSPEELPLDPKPAEPVRGTVPISFVTSVTSITSLEAGYQGDGENSRPASRGADPPSIVPPPNLPAPCRQDPMTDSDFFTESDADAYEEIVRGDRKAQVIDGTLFCAPGGRRCPSFTGEEMDSSGIYSDLDKRQDELHAPEEAAEENEDRTPDTIDTEVSQRSQPTPIKPDVTQVIMDYLQAPVNTLDGSADSNVTLSPAQVTVIEVERNNDGMRSKTQNKADSVPLKKYKMPKRNVVSKIKAMIESGPKDEAEKEARRSQRSPRKGGRWDAVMSKIEAGKNEQRTRSVRKEVKSRVLQSIGQSSTPGSTQKKIGDANNNSNKDKRRIRGRQELKSPVQETARSSVRSSLSDLSTGPSKDAPKRSPTSVNPPRRLVANGRSNQQNRVNSFDAKKNCVEISPINLEKSPSATRKPTITRRLTTTVPVKQHSSTISTKDRETKEHSNSYVVTRASLETRDQAAQTDIPYDALRVKRAEQVIEALSITVQYLAYELDAFSTPKLKKECENMKTEWLSSCTEIEELRTRNLGIEERLESERENNRRALDQLGEDLEAQQAEQIAALEAALQEERRRCEVRLKDSLNEAAKEHRAAIVKLRAEQEAELLRKESEFKRRSVVHDQGAALTAEVESLRSVLEIRSQENATLRSDLDNIRREIEDKEALQQRVDTLEARCEDLKAQLQCKEAFERQISHDNEVLHESIHQISKQNKRLAQRNEELQWRLRQKNEVVTVLANLTPRLSRSLGPENVEHTLSPDKNGPQASSMVKFMVEKGDSVSWTLEIDDEFSKSGTDTSHLATPSKMARSETSATVSRQGSLRLTPRRSSVDMRARSKSISVTDSARVEESAWSPTFNSTPIARRRPRSDPSSSASSTSSSSSSSVTAVTSNSAVAVAVAAAAAAAAAAEDCGAGQRPQEAGGEAMISEETSATSSEDESSTSSDIPPLPIQFAWGKPIK
ncbi:PREDICTED: uncharacterized protein LOC108578442 isoform X2 [Habropoda laboriosa]|uniref:uncharacterized protein LOC108578442 isoform X2 n=1 Tax=Habropoda laboriosa TaxID=597456 RepID=UPI00083D9105|nr:PREDICTED: uncharacterized protein LOC108578442 isoform X2 [Habropoda laboriosa]